LKAKIKHYQIDLDIRFCSIALDLRYRKRSIEEGNFALGSEADSKWLSCAEFLDIGSSEEGEKLDSRNRNRLGLPNLVSFNRAGFFARGFAGCRVSRGATLLTIGEARVSVIEF